MVCAHSICVRRGTEGQGSAGGTEERCWWSGRHPELGLQGGFQSLGKPVLKGRRRLNAGAVGVKA